VLFLHRIKQWFKQYFWIRNSCCVEIVDECSGAPLCRCCLFETKLLDMNMKASVILHAVFLLLPIVSISAQDRIELKNPSFDSDAAQMGKTPEGWIDLGVENSSPVDIQPGFWDVTLPAQDGRNFVAMVVRENNTWEGIGQVLEGWMRKDSTYSFSVWLAKSRIYMSPSPNSNGEILNFKAPTVLKIWGYNTSTRAEELLAESQPVGIAAWTKYTFVFTPRIADYDEIDLVAYYAKGQEGKNGNLLLDNCSAIIQVPK